MGSKDIIILALSILVCQLAGVVGSVFTSMSVDTWYVSVQKPFFTPPGWFIGLVWTLLFTLMGVSLYLVLKKGFKDRKVRHGLSFFGLQLVLNVVWSLLFFGLQNPFYAFIEIIVLWFAILATILSFLRVDRWAAYLLIPYLLWVSFAAFLNFSIWRLNI